MSEQAMREVTLDEWCAKLWPGHCVNTELARLRAQLAEANERVRVLEDFADIVRNNMGRKVSRSATPSPMTVRMDRIRDALVSMTATDAACALEGE